MRPTPSNFLDKHCRSFVTPPSTHHGSPSSAHPESHEGRFCLLLKIHALTIFQAQCRIFSSVYNPEGLRIGTKILRQRLKGPAMAAYYPPRPVTWSQFRRAYLNMGANVVDEDEEERLKKLDEYPPLSFRFSNANMGLG